MSRKKIKKEAVKRKTGIYDPMGVYGKGLTKNQRIGMTRRMKIENIRNPEKNITKEDLEEYQKLLEFYGMYNLIRSGHIETIAIAYDYTRLLTITNDTILQTLNDMNIHPQYFVCDTFVIERLPEEFWIRGLWYYITVGNSLIQVRATSTQVLISEDYPRVTVPRWFIDGTTMNYFKLCYDVNYTDMYISQEKHDFSGETEYEDLLRLPNNCTPIPYLLYPNTVYPQLALTVGMDEEQTVPYYVTLNVLVIY